MCFQTEDTATMTITAEPIPSHYQLSQDEMAEIEIMHDGPVAGGNYCDLFEGKRGQLRYALKRRRIFDPTEMADAIRRLEREGRFWKDLHHPNVLPFSGLMEREDKKYLVSPWVDRGNLHDFLTSRHQYFALPEAGRAEHIDHVAYSKFSEFDVITGITKGLEYLHTHLKGMIHGDLKPQNILLDDSLQPLLCDFGMTKDRNTITSLPLKGKGTRYQAPEVMMNSQKTTSSDVYALGMTISQVLTGQIPLTHMPSDGKLVVAIVVMHERPACQPTSFQGRDFRSLWKIASRCWEHDADKRPSAADVLVMLKEARESGFRFPSV